MKKLEMSQAAKGLQIGLYKHFKGHMYEVMGVCRHSETEEEMVAYRKLYDDFTWWVRPLGMFTETVERDGKTFKRFEYVGRNH
jgi:hypothetical protein